MTKKQLARAAQLLGAKGGRVTAARLTGDERTAMARHAATARWARYHTEQLEDINKKQAQLWEDRKAKGIVT